MTYVSKNFKSKIYQILDIFIVNSKMESGPDFVRGYSSRFGIMQIHVLFY